MLNGGLSGNSFTRHGHAVSGIRVTESGVQSRRKYLIEWGKSSVAERYPGLVCYVMSKPEGTNEATGRDVQSYQR